MVAAAKKMAAEERSLEVPTTAARRQGTKGQQCSG